MNVKEVRAKKHRFLRFVLWCAVICLGMELGLRLFGYGNYTIYRPDERLLWVPEPGRTLTVVNHLPITINNQGLRYATDLKPKAPGEFRILAFGDSSTQGWGVDDDSHYSAVLAKMLNAGACPKSHVLAVSAGVNAYSNSLVAEKLKETVDENYGTFQPDIAIVAYSFNSNFEKFVMLQGEARQEFLRRVQFKSIARRSALYNFLIEDLLRRVAYYQLRHLVVKGTLDTINGKDALDVDQFNAGLEQSLRICRMHHVQMVLLLLGSEGQTDELHPFQKAMLDFAAKQNVPLVNMINVMRTRDQKAMFMDPAHPTAAGHQVIAQQLANLVHGIPSYEGACLGVSEPTLNVAKSSSATHGATAR